MLNKVNKRAVSVLQASDSEEEQLQQETDNEEEQQQSDNEEEQQQSDNEEEQQESDNEEEQQESDNEEEQEESDNEEEQNIDNEYDLDAESTSSSEASFDDNEQNDNNAATELITNKLSQQIKQRYEQNRGKKLFIRFPAKLPAADDELLMQAKNLTNLITQVHRPRQKHARFCLVDFASQTDRDAALKEIRLAIKQKQPAYKGVVVNIPRTESAEFVDDLIKKKLTNLEAKKAKARLKRAAIVAKRTAEYTSTVIVTNLPQRTSTLELRTAFPNAVDMQIKRGKAAITLPSTFEARKVFKKPPIMSGVALKLRFHINRQNKRAGKQHRPKKEPTENAAEAVNSQQQETQELSSKIKRKLTQLSEAATVKKPKLQKKLKSQGKAKQEEPIETTAKPKKKLKMQQKKIMTEEITIKPKNQLNQKLKKQKPAKNMKTKA